MKNDRRGGKRTNWLLIKHRDDDAREGDGDALLTDPKSIASGRSLDAIAAGKGKAPTPFITRKPNAAGAVRESKSVKKPAKSSTTTAMPRFIEPQLCKLVERATSEPGWAHEVKFDGYRMQLRVENGDAQLRTRKGIDWTAKFGGMAAAASALPDCLLDGEVVALDKHGEPDFAALQAALSEHKTDELIYFAFDLLFVGGEDLRELPLRDRKARLKTPVRQVEAAADLPLRRSLRDGRRCGAAIGLSDASRRYCLQAPRCAVQIRPRNGLDQGQVPRRPRGGDRRLDQRGRTVALTAGRRLSRQRSWSMSGESAPASPRKPCGW